MPVIEERIDTLESILGQFIVHTDVALKRLENEMKEFKDEMRKFREEAERDRKSLHEEMKEFKDEMKEFKDEMTSFRNEMKEESKRKNREWSNLAKKMGTLVEDLIAPALRPVLNKYFGCDVSMEGQRMFRREDGQDYEVDAIAACNDKVFMVEVKSTPRFDDIKEILEKKERFFEFFPEHQGKDLIVIFGSITFADDVVEHAGRNGIYVLGWREWEYMDILNFDEVRLK
jgi:hypothetical protein